MDFVPEIVVSSNRTQSHALYNLAIPCDLVTFGRVSLACRSHVLRCHDVIGRALVLMGFDMPIILLVRLQLL